MRPELWYSPLTLAYVRDNLERRQNYNKTRPHSALADHPPETFTS